MRDMAQSICLIKLYQITMTKNFDVLFLTTLSTDKKSHKKWIQHLCNVIKGVRNARSTARQQNEVRHVQITWWTEFTHTS